MSKNQFMCNLQAKAFLAVGVLLGGCSSIGHEAVSSSSLGIDRLYAKYNCDELAQLAPIKEQALAASSANPEQYRVAAMYLTGLRQAQGEKGCSEAVSASTKADQTRSSSANSGAVNPTQDSVKGTIGVRIGPMTEAVAKGMGLPRLQGVLIVETLKGKAAERAGLRPMDVIIEYSGQAVSAPAELQQLISRTRPGFKAPIRVWRDRTTHEFVVEVENFSVI